MTGLVLILQCTTDLLQWQLERSTDQAPPQQPPHCAPSSLTADTAASTDCLTDTLRSTDPDMFPAATSATASPRSPIPPNDVPSASWPVSSSSPSGYQADRSEDENRTKQTSETGGTSNDDSGNPPPKSNTSDTEKYHRLRLLRARQYFLRRRNMLEDLSEPDERNFKESTLILFVANCVEDAKLFFYSDIDDDPYLDVKYVDDYLRTYGSTPSKVFLHADKREFVSQIDELGLRNLDKDRDAAHLYHQYRGKVFSLDARSFQSSVPVPHQNDLDVWYFRRQRRPGESDWRRSTALAENRAPWDFTLLAGRNLRQQHDPLAESTEDRRSVQEHESNIRERFRELNLLMQREEGNQTVNTARRYGVGGSLQHAADLNGGDQRSHTTSAQRDAGHLRTAATSPVDPAQLSSGQYKRREGPMLERSISHQHGPPGSRPNPPPNPQPAPMPPVRYHYPGPGPNPSPNPPPAPPPPVRWQTSPLITTTALPTMSKDSPFPPPPLPPLSRPSIPPPQTPKSTTTPYPLPTQRPRPRPNPLSIQRQSRSRQTHQLKPRPNPPHNPQPSQPPPGPMPKSLNLPTANRLSRPQTRIPIPTSHPSEEASHETASPAASPRSSSEYYTALDSEGAIEVGHSTAQGIEEPDKSIDATGEGRKRRNRLKKTKHKKKQKEKDKKKNLKRREDIDKATRCSQVDMPGSWID